MTTFSVQLHKPSFTFNLDAVEESPSLRMFGEEDVEDKSENKLILAADSLVSLSEEVKQVIVEEDEKQPAD